MNRLEFKCKECGGDRLEEVMVNVTVSTELSQIVEKNGEFDMEYNNQTNEDGSIEKFQCIACGAGALSLEDLVKSGALTTSSEVSA